MLHPQQLPAIHPCESAEDKYMKKSLYNHPQRVKLCQLFLCQELNAIKNKSLIKLFKPQDGSDRKILLTVQKYFATALSLISIHFDNS